MKSQGRWTRDYVYESINNRLLKHDSNQANAVYTYDAHGNMLTMPHLPTMEWDSIDYMHKSVRGNDTTWYKYDTDGNRRRKITDKPGGIKEERIYHGDYELYRKYVNDVLQEETRTVHVSDGEKRIATVDYKTVENGVAITSYTDVVRYQYDNHLGSACLELDANALTITYEEYHPFGTSSYKLADNDTEVKRKRYRYVGKERDEETGLYYYGARYYAAWIARFVSVDPLQHKYPHYTPYQYAGNKPISYIDLDGLEEAKKEDTKQQETKQETPSKIIFENEEAKKYHLEKITPVYKKKEDGSFKLDRKKNPILEKGAKYDREYADLIKEIESKATTNIIIKKKNRYEIGNITGKGASYGTVFAGEINNKTNLYVAYSNPLDDKTNGFAIGGDWKYTFIEEMYHVKQILNSSEWQKSQEIPIITPKMEVEAKQFAVSQCGHYESEYEKNGWHYPTEAGIMSGNAPENSHINPEDYLSKKTTLNIYKIEYNEQGRKQKKPFEWTHNPYY